LDQIIIICGQYEGFDERIRCLADEEISIGDYVLSGGEIPAISIINGLTRLIPGTLGDADSLVDESHNSSFLEYPSSISLSDITSNKSTSSLAVLAAFAKSCDEGAPLAPFLRIFPPRFLFA